jgi:hypothetical protein
MLALLGAVLFAVVAILHIVTGYPIETILTDIGLVCVALALALGSAWPVPWRHA